MSQFFTFLHEYIDYIILGLLGLMSFIMLWFALERFIFLSRVQVSRYTNIHELDIDLTRNLTTISTIGSNAPYVGLLGTVIGILLTFYELGNSGGDIDLSGNYAQFISCLKSDCGRDFSRNSINGVL